jgi:hypothetical protein
MRRPRHPKRGCWAIEEEERKEKKSLPHKLDNYKAGQKILTILEPLPSIITGHFRIKF